MGLRWEDVNLDRGTLRVTHSLQRIDGEWRFVEPKSKRSARTLSLPSIVAAALREHWDRQAFERRAAGDEWRDLGLVFATAKGTPLEPSNLNGRLHRLQDACEVPRQGMHSLRHCCASLLLAQGISPRVVMEQLGHSQISLTMDTYAHVIPAMLQDAANALDKALGACDQSETG
jgi:integrase